MSDTPFTDSCTYGFTDEDGIHCEAVHADVARTLERERDQARNALREIAGMDALLRTGLLRCGAVLIAMNALEVAE